jgi:hypothetical protein
LDNGGAFSDIKTNISAWLAIEKNAKSAAASFVLGLWLKAGGEFSAVEAIVIDLFSSLARGHIDPAGIATIDLFIRLYYSLSE